MSKYENWSQEEINILTKYYANSSKEEIQKMLPKRKIGNINTKAHNLGIKKETWNLNDVSQLKQLFNEGLSPKDIAKYFNGKYTASAVRCKLNKIGLKYRTNWSDEEIQIMKEHYPVEPIDNFIDLLNNRTRNAIINQAVKLKLKSYLTWADEEEKYLIDNWNILSDYELSLELKKSQLCVKTKRKHLGLFRTNRDEMHYESLAKYLRANNTEWKNNSMKKCDYKCIVTGSKDFQIHHLVNVSTIIRETLKTLKIDYKEFKEYSKEELNLILNKFLEIQSKYPYGVCIRKDIHILYHSLYGQQNNNEKQFHNFIQNYKNGVFDKFIEK